MQWIAVAPFWPQRRSRACHFCNWDDSELHVVNVIPSFKYYVLALERGIEHE